MLRPAQAAQPVELRFEVVPAYDLVMSLAAAAQPEEHELPVSWARGVRSSLPVAVRRELTFFFGDPAALGAGAVQLIPDLGVTEPAELLDALAQVEPADLAVAMLARKTNSRSVRGTLRRMARGKAVSEEDERAVGQYAASLRADTRKRFWEILGDPARARERYLALLRAHHAAWSGTYASDILPFLAQRAKQGRRSIGKLPANEVIARATKGFTLEAPAARSALLIPSYYAAPFVIVVRDGREVVLVYGVRPSGSRGERPPLGIDTARVLKALADETRLRILELLAERPLYGQQLAEALGVSHPTVSHHMAQLRIAGLTRTELAEDGNKTYYVRPETVELLCTELRSAFVERGGA